MTEKLWLAFASLDFLAGQLWAKFAVTLVTVGVLWMARQRRTAWHYAH